MNIDMLNCTNYANGIIDLIKWKNDNPDKEYTLGILLHTLDRFNDNTMESNYICHHIDFTYSLKKDQDTFNSKSDYNLYLQHYPNIQSAALEAIEFIKKNRPTPKLFPGLYNHKSYVKAINSSADGFEFDTSSFWDLNTDEWDIIRLEKVKFLTCICNFFLFKNLEY